VPGFVLLLAGLPTGGAVQVDTWRSSEAKHRVRQIVSHRKWISGTEWGCTCCATDSERVPTRHKLKGALDQERNILEMPLHLEADSVCVCVCVNANGEKQEAIERAALRPWQVIKDVISLCKVTARHPRSGAFVRPGFRWSWGGRTSWQLP
jgi:hypothetical protein